MSHYRQSRSANRRLTARGGSQQKMGWPLTLRCLGSSHRRDVSPSTCGRTEQSEVEMAALRVQDFDMLRRWVNVSQSVTESGGLVWSTPKTWERRSVPFPAVLADELAALMIDKDRNALVFTDMRGGVLRNSNWRARVFEPAVAKCRRRMTRSRRSLRTTCGTPRQVWRCRPARMSKRCNGCSATPRRR